MPKNTMTSKPRGKRSAAGNELSRGVVYVCWGNAVEDELRKSIASVGKYTDLPHRVIRLDGKKHHAAKIAMYDNSPFDLTLFLDTDTIVSADLSCGFQQIEEFDIAVALAPACFADRWPINESETFEYNTGVLFFRKCGRIREFFKAWAKNAEAFPYSDQASFAKTIVESGINPAVLPGNYNFRGSMGAKPFFGPIKVWHSREEIPGNIAVWNAQAEYRFGEVIELNGKNQIVPHGERPVYIRRELVWCARRIAHLLAAGMRTKMSGRTKRNELPDEQTNV